MTAAQAQALRQRWEAARQFIRVGDTYRALQAAGRATEVDGDRIIEAAREYDRVRVDTGWAG